MIILLAVIALILIITAISLLVMSYNQLLLGYQTAIGMRQKVRDIFFTIFQKMTVFIDDYKNYLSEESGQKVAVAANELKDWLSRTSKELNQGWDWKLIQVVAGKLQIFLGLVCQDSKFSGDKNLEYIQKSKAMIDQIFSGYQKVIAAYNRRIKKFPARFIGQMKNLPDQIKS